MIVRDRNGGKSFNEFRIPRGFYRTDSSRPPAAAFFRPRRCRREPRTGAGETFGLSLRGL